MDEEIKKIYKQALSSHQKGKFNEAEAFYQKVLDIYPKVAEVNHNFGILKTFQNKYDEAIQLFKTAITYNPNEFQFWISFANSLVIGKEFNEAIAGYKKAIMLNGQSAIAYYGLGTTFYKINKLDEAEASLTKATQLKENFALPHYFLGNIKYNLGKLNEAEVCFNQAIQFKSDYFEAYNNIGIVLFKLKKFQEAELNYKKAIQLKPDYFQAYNNFGVMLHKLKKFEEAEICFNKTIQLNPKFADVYNNLGSLLMDLGRFEEAEINCKKAIKFNPNNADALNTLGNIFKERNKLEDAENCFIKAIKFKPDHADAHYNYGVMLYSKKNYKKAIEHFKLTDAGMSKSFLLNALYQLHEKDNFYSHLDHLLSQDYNDALIGSLISRSEIRYKVNRPNPFCNDPLNYILTTDLLKNSEFQDNYLNNAIKILNNDKVHHKSQTLLTNGIQTLGNIFGQLGNKGKEIQKIIYSEIEKYRLHFKESEEGFLINWPNNYNINGWLVSMKRGGNLRSHIHEYGWLSGSIYLNVPKNLKNDQGNLVIGLDSELHNSTENTKSINVVTGSLCLFPSSLHHCTIPFESEEDRIVLAFDVLPVL